jgi:cytochrome c
MRTRLWKLNALWKLNVCLGAGLIFGCKGGQTTLPYTVTTGGSADQGKATIVAYRCGECHTIPGVPDAKGVFGPPLMSLSRRTYIGGNFPNTPENLVHWVMSPKSMKPRTAMPNLGLSEPQARQVAAYLYTLR